MKQPRPEQLEAVEAVESYTGSKGRMLVMPTGVGKTFTAMLLVSSYIERGLRVLWCADRRELLLQAAETLAEMRPDFEPGFVGNGLGDDYDHQVVFAMKDSAIRKRRMEKLEGFDLMVVDECHHAAAAGWKKLIAHISAPVLLGLTATPDRADTKRLSEGWEIVYSMTIQEAIDKGYLLPLWAGVDRPPALDLSRVTITRRDYVPAELETELLRNHIVEHTVAAIHKAHTARKLPFRDEELELCPAELDGGILVYCVTVNQAQLTAAAVADSGLTAAVVYGEMDPDDRALILSEFRAGRIKVLVNVGILTEGTDLPWAQTVILARPTTSWSLFMQIVGRAVRRHGEQELAFICDLVGATDYHSIISAAVLVDGTDCEESHNGRHYYLPLPTGEGQCQHCQATIKCYEHKGSHKFKDGVCSCGAAQCPMGENNQHHFVPWEPGTRKCLYCGVEVPDPVGALVGRTNPPKEPVVWNRLNLPDEVWASHLGKSGILFNVRRGSLWRPLLVTDVVQPLSRSAVSKEMSRLLTDDVAKRSNKVAGKYGSRRKKQDLDHAMRDALRIAKRTEIWRR